jgi:hypothetical protein
MRTTVENAGRDSSVGIATGYRLDSPGIESRWVWEIFRTRPDRPRGIASFPGVKRPGRDADHPPLLVPSSGKSRAIPLPPSRHSGLLRGTFILL